MMYSTILNNLLGKVWTWTTLILACFICTVSEAQEIRTNRPTSPSSSPVNSSFGDNTNVVQDTTASDTVAKVNTFKTLFKGKPGKAALYSLIAPGGGQIYNRRWWKVPLAIGIDAGFTYNLILKKQDYNEFNAIVEAYINDPKYINPYTKEQAINERSVRRGQVEYAWVYLVLAHLFTVFEAYIDRHLMDFDVSRDLTNSPHTLPDLQSSQQPRQPYQPILSVAYRF